MYPVILLTLVAHTGQHLHLQTRFQFDADYVAKEILDEISLKQWFYDRSSNELAANHERHWAASRGV